MNCNAYMIEHVRARRSSIVHVHQYSQIKQFKSYKAIYSHWIQREVNHANKIKTELLTSRLLQESDKKKDEKWIHGIHSTQKSSHSI